MIRGRRSYRLNFFNFLTSDKISLTSDKKNCERLLGVGAQQPFGYEIDGDSDYLKRQVMVPSPLVVRLLGTAKRLLRDSRSQ